MLYHFAAQPRLVQFKRCETNPFCDFCEFQEQSGPVLGATRCYLATPASSGPAAQALSHLPLTQALTVCLKRRDWA